MSKYEYRLFIVIYDVERVTNLMWAYNIVYNINI